MQKYTVTLGQLFFYLPQLSDFMGTNTERCYTNGDNGELLYHVVLGNNQDPGTFNPQPDQSNEVG